MKEKNMWKELLNRAGWILVFLRLFVNCSGLKSAKLEKGQILSFLF
ncbi:caax amino protease family protein [Streptococcus pneumoniae]|nr:caax amino protease family protein [Streptococcus pneumoniae]VTH02344.1 caax amino protease family protein [Streptococcus pneumoniae]VTH90085.1 caax amino protease family protein [Streptococcus pneumoniae]